MDACKERDIAKNGKEESHVQNAIRHTTLYADLTKTFLKPWGKM